MRTEKEIEAKADQASTEIAAINDVPLTAESKERREYLRGVLAALDWANDEDSDDDPLE